MENYEGKDGLILKDLKELRLGDTINFDRIPVRVEVMTGLSKARHKYFSFIGEENQGNILRSNKSENVRGYLNLS